MFCGPWSCHKTAGGFTLFIIRGYSPSLNKGGGVNDGIVNLHNSSYDNCNSPLYGKIITALFPNRRLL